MTPLPDEQGRAKLREMTEQNASPLTCTTCGEASGYRAKPDLIIANYDPDGKPVYSRPIRICVNCGAWNGVDVKVVRPLEWVTMEAVNTPAFINAGK